MESPLVTGSLLFDKVSGITGSGLPFGSSAGRTVRMEDKQGGFASVVAGIWAPLSAVLSSDNVLELLERRGWTLLSECPGCQEIIRSYGNTLSILLPSAAALQLLFGLEVTIKS